jgi:hypothetical protein
MCFPEYHWMIFGCKKTFRKNPWIFLTKSSFNPRRAFWNLDCCNVF